MQKSNALKLFGYEDNYKYLYMEQIDDLRRRYNERLLECQQINYDENTYSQTINELSIAFMTLYDEVIKEDDKRRRIGFGEAAGYTTQEVAMYESSVKDGLLRLLVSIDTAQNKRALSKEELKFIYEVDNPISLYHDTDIYKLLDKVKSNRDAHKDLAYALDIKEENIGLAGENKGDANYDYEYYYGGIHSNDITPNLKLPKTVNGYVHLASLKTADGLVLPDIITKDLNLFNLSIDDILDIKLPSYVGGKIIIGYGLSYTLEELQQEIYKRKNSFEPDKEDNLHL